MGGVTSSLSGTRTGGRSARIRSAVHRAVRELLIEEARDELTVPAVAARADVHATTVYRRWGTLGELLADVAASRFSGDIVVPDTGTLRGDLERWAADVAVDLADPDSLAVLRAGVGAGESASCGCVDDRHHQLAAMLDRETARGGSRPSVEEAADALLGPIYYRALFTTAPADAAWARGRVAALLGLTST
jgi:AcrR family transcriptional regulator